MPMYAKLIKRGVISKMIRNLDMHYFLFFTTKTRSNEMKKGPKVNKLKQIKKQEYEQITTII